MTISEAYRAERAKNLPAIDAIRGARYAANIAGLEFPDYAGDEVRIDLPRGEYIVCKLEDDSDNDVRERLGCSWTDDGVPEDGRRVGWMDREGRVLFDADPDGYGYAWRMWIADTTGWTLADRIAQRRKAGMSRHDAWLDARASIAKEFDYFREVWEAGYVGYVVTLHGADDSEVYDESCWGLEAVGDYAGQEARSVAEGMAEKRARYWTQQVEVKRDEARDLRDTVRALVADLRDGMGDVAAAVVNNKVCELRARHSACMRIVAGGAA